MVVDDKKKNGEIAQKYISDCYSGLCKLKLHELCRHHVRQVIYIKTGYLERMEPDSTRYVLNVAGTSGCQNQKKEQISVILILVSNLYLVNTLIYSFLRDTIRPVVGKRCEDRY